jgi:3-deoxy-D-manno-octulosonic-acid transferase
MGNIFSSISAICAQTEMDAQRFVAIGARKDKVEVTGNLKFDYKLMRLSGGEISRLRASMGIGPGVSVFLAGSTHEGEEKILLKCFMVLKKSFADLILVVVPRDPTRAYRTQQMFERAGCPASLKSELDEMDGHDASHAIVVDTMGELRQLYAIADVVFVGKSLVNLGGQNPLEPAAFKKPILFGPHMFNFELVAEMLIQQGGAVEVANEKELMEQVKSLLLDSKRCETMGMKAYEVLGMNRGAVEKTLNVVERFL